MRSPAMAVPARSPACSARRKSRNFFRKPSTKKAPPTRNSPRSPKARSMSRQPTPNTSDVFERPRRLRGLPKSRLRKSFQTSSIFKERRTCDATEQQDRYGRAQEKAPHQRRQNGSPRLSDTVPHDQPLI